ncbi:hypothetical protein ACE14D_01140 [Streptomyces sp. Act-28]
MLTGRLGATLPAWIDAVDASRLPGLTGFALHLHRDLEAVTADLTLDWSSGSIEGAVNRIKKIKRQLCGRAGFELLRKTDPAPAALQDAPQDLRASLYRAWGHFEDEFEQRRAAAWAAGHQPDPHEARIARLRDLNQRLTSRLARTHTEFKQLKERHHPLLSVLATKDDGLQRLRRELSTFPAPGPDQGQGDNAMGVVPLPRL